MPSKTMHSFAGLATGGLLAYATQSDLAHTAMLLVGAGIGASAPDWMEVPTWVTTRHWFRANENHRRSLIPHRTITHTLDFVWLTGAFILRVPLWLWRWTHSCWHGLLCVLWPPVLCMWRWMASTPMGIPLIPFGRRHQLAQSRSGPWRFEWIAKMSAKSD